MMENTFFEYKGFKVFIESYKSQDPKSKYPYETHARLINNQTNPIKIKIIGIGVSANLQDSIDKAIQEAKNKIDSNDGFLDEYL